ncbi:MAG: helix-turn-helix domain-containing protein [Desulfovibrio sp.]|nr:helix-turn-helix domain-containing protein [Desulfovibrio sp.]
MSKDTRTSTIVAANLEVMTTAQATSYLQITPNTLKSWRIKGCGPACSTMGRILRYRRTDFDAFLQEMQDKNKQAKFAIAVSNKK